IRDRNVTGVQTCALPIYQILAYRPDTKIIALAPLVQNQIGEFRVVIEKTKREGFVRVRIDGEIVELGGAEPIRLKKNQRHTIEEIGRATCRERTQKKVCT